MTLPRLKAMGLYWKKNPPLHLLVAGFMGVKPEIEAGDIPPLPPDIEP